MISIHPIKDLDVISRVSDDIRVLPGVTVRLGRSRNSFGTVVSITEEGATILWTKRPTVDIQQPEFQGRRLSQREIDAFNWTAETIHKALDARAIADAKREHHIDGSMTFDIKAWPEREDYELYQRGQISRKTFGF